MSEPGTVVAAPALVTTWMRGSDMTDRTCSVEGCERPWLSRRFGWCRMHYKRWVRHGDPTTLSRVRRPAPADGLCTIAECGQPHRTRGWCALHYNRWLRHGDPLDPRPGSSMRPNGLRRCGACKEEKPTDKFCRSANRPDGLAHNCRACANTIYARWAKANPQKPRDIGARRRARKMAVPNERIESEIVYERDGWLCGICASTIDPSHSWPHPMSPSVDHLIPLAAGGAHLYSNVQAAHLGCNISKGARTG